MKMIEQVAAVAVLCIQPEPSYRPLITDVLHSLIPLVPVELGGSLRVSEPVPTVGLDPSHWTKDGFDWHLQFGYSFIHVQFMLVEGYGFSMVLVLWFLTSHIWITWFHWNLDKIGPTGISPVSLPAAVYFSEHNVVYSSTTLLTSSSCTARQKFLFLIKLVGFNPFSVYCIVASV